MNIKKTKPRAHNSEKSWYARPFGILINAITGTVIATIIAVYFTNSLHLTAWPDDAPKTSIPYLPSPTAISIEELTQETNYVLGLGYLYPQSWRRENSYRNRILYYEPTNNIIFIVGTQFISDDIPVDTMLEAHDIIGSDLKYSLTQFDSKLQGYKLLESYSNAMYFKDYDKELNTKTHDPIPGWTVKYSYTEGDSYTIFKTLTRVGSRGFFASCRVPSKQSATYDELCRKLVNSLEDLVGLKPAPIYVQAELAVRARIDRVLLIAGSDAPGSWQTVAQFVLPST